MSRRPLLLPAALLLVLSQAAALPGHAEDLRAPATEPTAAARQACRADYVKFCKGVQPGGGRILACLKQHNDELAPHCKAALDKAPAAPTN